MSILSSFLIAQQAVAQMYSFGSRKSPYQEVVIMIKRYLRIYETSCFAMVQQAVAQKACIVDYTIGQQLVAQKARV